MLASTGETGLRNIVDSLSWQKLACSLEITADASPQGRNLHQCMSCHSIDIHSRQATSDLRAMLDRGLVNYLLFCMAPRLAARESGVSRGMLRIREDAG